MGRAAQVAFWALGLSFVAMVVTGVWLSFEYEPGSGVVSAIHGTIGAVAVVAALVGSVATVADAERSTVGILPAIVMLFVAGGLYLTGPTLAWDQLGADGPVRAKGVTAAFDANVGALLHGSQSIQADDYRRVAYLHTIGLPLMVVVMGGAGLWAARRSARR